MPNKYNVGAYIGLVLLSGTCVDPPKIYMLGPMPDKVHSKKIHSMYTIYNPDPEYLPYMLDVEEICQWHP